MPKKAKNQNAKKLSRKEAAKLLAELNKAPTDKDRPEPKAKRAKKPK